MFSTLTAVSVRLRTFHLCALHNVARSERRLSAASTITFDAFDTLITRSVLRPSDAFLIVGNQLRQAGLSLRDPRSWAKLRAEAEHHCARRAKPLEVTIAQIYSRLAELGGINESRQKEAMEVEASVELRISSPIAYTSALLQRTNAAGKRTAILSDTYLNKTDLLALLKSCSPRIDSANVFASSETLATKRSGALFGVFSRRHGSPPGQIVHIGDNLSSDVLNARRAGYKAAPYIYSKPNRYERALARDTISDGIVGSVMAGSARATRLSRTFDDQRLETIWNVSCGVTGPLLFAFV